MAKPKIKLVYKNAKGKEFIWISQDLEDATRVKKYLKKNGIKEIEEFAVIKVSAEDIMDCSASEFLRIV